MKEDVMRLIKGAALVLALILTVRAMEIPVQPATHPDYAPQVGHSDDGGWAARRIWNGGGATEDGEGKTMVVEASYGVIPGGNVQGGIWAVASPLVGDDGAAPWDAAASESEARGVYYSGERTRWMPSKSRYRTRKDPVEVDNSEIPLQEHQRRQRLQLQQQLLKRAPEGRRGVMQLENLGGGILVDDDDEEPEEEDEEEGAGDRARPPVPPPPQPFGKLPALRPPTGTNEPTAGKTPSAGDLKSILKMTGPLSLSEILQRKNLSLEELLRGSRFALSAVAQAATTESGEGATRSEQRRRRPVPTGSRPLLKRRRPTPPPELVPDPPSTPTQRHTTTTQTTTQRTTTTSTATTTTEEPRTTTVDEGEVGTDQLPLDPPSQPPAFTSSGDSGKEILDIILQEDENDGPSLADVLSSRNMTVADLIEQRERASGRSAITSLFPASSAAVKEWERRKSREEERKGREEERKKDEERKDTREQGEGRRGRKFVHFDLMEADWDDPLVTKTDEILPDNKPAEEEIADQQVTQTRNTYQIISSQDKVVDPPKPSEPNFIHPPKPSEPNVIHPPKTSETKISHTQTSSFREIPTFQEDGHRPIIRTRVTVPATTTDESLTKEQTHIEDSAIHNTQRAVNEEYGHEEPLTTPGLPEGVKSAIIASSSLLGIALLIFLSIFAAFRYRQWRRRRGMGPYLCVAVLEAAAGSKKGKGPKIVKQGKTKEKGWGDTFDSAQERLWRTLRRGRCRFYDRENGQM